MFLRQLTRIQDEDPNFSRKLIQYFVFKNHTTWYLFCRLECEL